MSVELPDLFVPFGSVNPYRPDSLQELERCAQLGVTTIKWLVSIYIIANMLCVEIRQYSVLRTYVRMYVRHFTITYILLNVKQ